MNSLKMKVQYTWIFFLLASLMGVPVLGLIYLIQRHEAFRQ